jgi:putative ABC transport system permease protein
MLKLAIKNGFYRPARTFLTVLAVAAILAEILMLEGFMSGTYTQLRKSVLERGGDVIVAQTGISNFIAARSVLPQQVRAEVEAQPGVAEAHPLTSLMLIYEAGGRLSPILIVVYDDAGGPATVTEGRAPQGTGEIAIDRALAKRYGLAIGDKLTLSAYDFTITGITEGAAAIFTPFAFVTFDGLIDFYFESDVGADIAAFPLLSFLLVDVAPGADPAEVAASIDANIPDADTFLPETLATNDENLGRELFGPILSLLLGLSYAIGALAIGLFSFAAVRSRKKTLGVLRALGFTTRHLMAGVVIEALFTALLAIPLGVAMASGLAMLIENMSPVYLIETGNPVGLWRTGAIAVLLAILGGLAPLGTMRRLDPATAFRG